VLGPIDHGSILSIYFHDPNGLRLEIATPLTSDWNRRVELGQNDLAEWIAAKNRAREQGKDVSKALIEFIRDRKQSAA
jgi:hypothetical protein